jgi:flavin reductase (DIM6/NTAB) family NADH-FMN oxidoreductase RutF
MRKDFGKKLSFIPLPVLIIGTYDEKGNANAMNAAWGVQYDYQKVSIVLAEHKTTHNFEKTKAFTVSFATKDTIKISDYFGIVSGNDEDKIKKSGVKVVKSNYVNAPIILDYPLTLECEVESYENELLIGNVINVSVDEKILTDGKIDVNKLNPICFDSITNSYRVLGDVVGKAFKDGLELK